MNQHPTDEQLVLYYYGETQELAGHLTSCTDCRDNYQALQRVLNSVDSLPVPERDAGYEAQVWRSLQPKLAPRRPWYVAWPSWRPFLVAGAMAGLLVIAFLVGRGAKPTPKP